MILLQISPGYDGISMRIIILIKIDFEKHFKRKINEKNVT